jgi:putative lipoic acid-binding regulatory protein
MEKPIQEMTSDELFAYAQSRRIEEAEIARREYRDQLNSLRQRRREITKAYNKETASIDASIRKIRQKMSPNTAIPTNSKGKSSGGNISAAVIAILQQNGEMNTKAIHEALKKDGINAANLSQTLSYLKRQEKVVSPTRANYKLA